MKKFEFSLQSVFEYKQTVEKDQKAELSRAEAVLRELREREQALDEAFRRNSEEQDAVLERGVDIVSELEKFAAFFRHVREEKEILRVKIENAEEVKARCQARLIVTMRELKTYRKLRDEQYARYLKDVETEEEKEMNDHVSFTSATAGERKNS